MTTSHYFSEKQESALKKKKIICRLLGNKLEFFTGSGVFSKRRIDKGAMMLIESAVINEKSKILDFGAGYGAVGIALARAFPNSQVFMLDINERAVMLAKENLKLNKIENATAIKSDLFENMEEKDFDAILLNPPQTAGRKVCERIIEESPTYLKAGGTMQLVARHNKGGRTLEAKMKDIFGNVRALAKSAGYRVYLSRKS